uniref:T-cell-interacting, activating receptor on myeloid cells protein 1-like n=1 Tax=Ictidomys tridecemlineatus TaxID=43179 RepID=UPI001A9CEACC|nr:T-cell-interacting, activating receptor on myeloid cells protein 1-like [Ictidomys tridecemlineatus]
MVFMVVGPSPAAGRPSPGVSSEGYTKGNLVRLGVAAGVLLMGVVLVLEAWHARGVPHARPGLCLGLADQGENEKLPRPSLRAWPSSVVELGSSVTLQCRAGFQNATFMLGKSHDPGFKQEQSSAETQAEFPLASLQPEDAGGYFCAYKTATTGQWSEQSQRLQLVVTGSWPAPSLSVSADPEAAPGHRTLRCLTPNNGSECLITALLRTGTPDPVQVKEGRENQTDFTLRESGEDGGSYSCVYYQCHWPHLGSSRSSRLEMQATGEDSG